MKLSFHILLTIALPVLLISSQCHRNVPATKHVTENIIILVIDGPRWSETWGDSAHKYIPNFHELEKQGVVLTNFRNNGYTRTVAGHTAILTGVYQDINNIGAEFPIYPSLFQCFLKQSGYTNDMAWLITSKDKLEVLSNCEQQGWKDKFRPSRDCGVNGLASDYREDSITYLRMIDVLSKHHPRLALFQFKDPDDAAHNTGAWENYTQGIKNTDAYFKKLWDYIQTDSIYKGKTTFIMTNDHGRHVDSNPPPNRGFQHHGDTCDGCRHINFFASGPGIKKNAVLATPYEQIDIAATVAYLMGFDMPYNEGKVMTEILTP